MGRKFAISLSGGGFRAMLFHLGTIRALRDAGLLKLPNQLTNISSVSGGSIIAAHMVLNWRAYTSGSDDEFEKITGELIDLARQDLRGRVVRRMPLTLFCGWVFLGLFPVIKILRYFLRRWARYFPERPSTTHVLQREYQRFLKNSARAGRSNTFTLQDMHEADVIADKALPRYPKLQMLATNLNTIELCSFSQDGIRFPFNHDHTCGHAQPLSLAIAASSAFPAIFAPIRVRYRFLAWSDKNYKNYFLTDGGVLDNLGLRAIDEVLANDQSIEFALISDATGCAQANHRRIYSFALPATMRAIDVLVQEIRALQEKWVRMGDSKSKYVLAAIDSMVDPSHCPKHLQRLLASIRTDFDKFTDGEIYRLVRHGYFVTLDALRARQIGDPPPFNWGNGWPVAWSSPPEAEIDGETQLLSDASTRAWRLFSRKDWVPTTLAALAIIVSLAVATRLIVTGFASKVIGNDTTLYPINFVMNALTEAPRYLELQDGPLYDAPYELHYDGFEFLSDRRMFDLRGWRSDQDRMNLHRSISIRRTKAVESIGFRFSTQGEDVLVSGSGPSAPIYYKRDSDSPSRSTNKDRWVVFNTTSVPIGSVFEVKLHATFIKCCAKPQQHWVGAYFPDTTRAPFELMLLMPSADALRAFNLPESMRVVDVRRRIEDRSREPTAYLDASAIGHFYHSNTYDWMVWIVDDPQPHFVYRIDWQWDSSSPPVWELDK